MSADYHLEASVDARAYEYAALLYAVGYLCVLGFAWATKYSVVVGATPADAAYCAKYGSICLMVKSLGGDGTDRGGAIANMVYVFLAVTNLRIILASMLCHSATSPLRRAVSLPNDRALGRLVLLYALIKIIALTSLWRAYLVGVSEPWLLPAGLVAESALVLLFDRIFIAEMRDIRQYKTIIGMDLGAFLFSVVWLGLALVMPDPPGPGLAAVLLAGFGAIVIPFAIFALVEFRMYLTQFWISVIALRAELRRAQSATGSGGSSTLVTAPAATPTARHATNNMPAGD